ncbi:lysozyme inhibitor LprI family protein [Roseobacter sp. HKCCA0882]|uniref:lysozyme inhibitor LprI family protein n=1 Tax=Roseobacter sp. HKCCA0882 TaxID=3120337 RepID=UPI0030EC2D4E
MNIQFKSLGFVLALCCSSFAVQANAASFDCSLANTDTERTICASPELSKLDELLASLYQLKAQVDLDANYFASTFSGYDRGYEIEFPNFTFSETQETQRQWIQNVQSNCYSDLLCLVSAYQERVSEFFYSFDNVGDATSVSGEWRIASMVNLPNSSNSVILWRYDYPYDPYRSEKPYFYLFGIHDRQGNRLEGVNSNLLGYVDDPYRMIEVGITAQSATAFSITISEMRSAGGWGASNFSYDFYRQDGGYSVARSSLTSWGRNTFLFEDRVIDFRQNRYTQTFENLGEEAQEVNGVILEVDDSVAVELSTPDLPPLSFSEVSEQSFYDLLDDILEK